MSSNLPRSSNNRNSYLSVGASKTNTIAFARPIHPDPRNSSRNVKPGTPRVSVSGDLRLGERRLRLPSSPNFTNPRANLNKLFSADITDSSASGDSSSRIEIGEFVNSSSGVNMSSTRFSFKAPGHAFSGQINSVRSTNIFTPVRHGMDGKLNENVDRPNSSSSKKRKLERILSDSSMNSDTTDGPKSMEVLKLESENHRLRFECDSATKLMQTERLLVEEKLKQRKLEEEEMAAKTKEMWSEAEKILDENTRLKGKLENAETEAIALRKTYEDQIAVIKIEYLNKNRQQDKDLRECRADNLALNEKVKSLVRERERLCEEKKLHEKQEVEYQRVLVKCRSLESDLHAVRTDVQAKAAQIENLVSSSSLLTNMPEEINHYRELQVTVPLLRKENEKLREKAALARANEYKIQSQQETIAKYEERQRNYCELELENERLREQISDWNQSEDVLGASPRRIPERVQKLLDELAESERQRGVLADELQQKTKKVEELTSANNEFAKKLHEAKSAAEASLLARSRVEQDLKEKTNAFIAVEKERDTLKLIKETIHSTTARRPDNATQQKIRELEERATRSQVLASDFEQRFEQRSSELEELREELKQVRERYNAEVISNQKIALNLNEEIDALKKTKEELEEKLNGEVNNSANLSQFMAITLENSPVDLAQKRRLEEAEKVFEENKLLHEKLNHIRATGSCPSDLTMNAEDFLKGPGEQIEELKKQIEKLEKQRNMDMNTFKKTSSNFRQICKVLLGWNVRFDANKAVFRVADASTDDTIVFEREDESHVWELRMTDYAAANAQYVDEFLTNHKSPPGFFARIILQILSERTLICLGNSPSITP